MNHDPNLPPEVAAMFAAYDLALARQARRIELALEVLQAPGQRTEWEIIAASNTLITYGDAIEVQRATMALRAAVMRLQKANEAVAANETVHSWRQLLSVEAFLSAIVILGGFYIFCGLAAAIFKTYLP